MLLIPPPKYRRSRRPAVETAALPTPPSPPVLVAATYVDGSTLTLTFDRAIDVDGLNSGSFIVDDPDDTGERWIGNGANQVSPVTVVISLSDDGGATTPHVELTVAAGNEIRAVVGELEWAGVSGLVLPFSS